MENSGKMTYPEVIDAFSGMLYNLKNRITSDYLALGIVMVLVAFSIINIRTTSSEIIYIVLLLVIIALVFLAFIDIHSLAKDTRIYNKDRKRFNAMLTEISIDSPEDIYSRYMLTLFIAQIQVICKKDLDFIPHIPNVNPIKISIQNLTPLGIWDMLSQEYPNIHACKIHDARNDHYYILHLDGNGSATCTFLSAEKNSAHYSLWSYKTITLPAHQDFADILDSCFKHFSFKKLNTYRILDWDNTESVDTFHSIAFPAHQTTVV